MPWSFFVYGVLSYVVQLVAQVVVHEREVDALSERLLVGLIENVVNHLVEQSALVDVPLAHAVAEGLVDGQVGWLEVNIS